jgi:pectate lyase-like protein
MTTSTISGKGEHAAVADTDRIPASKAPFSPGTGGYHEFAAIKADILAQAPLRVIPTIADLKAVNTAAITSAFLGGDRFGWFRWLEGDYSAQVTADPLEGIYIEADDVSASEGAWVRVFDGLASVKWWGATGDGTTDDRAAIQAAINLFDPTFSSGGLMNSAAKVFLPEGDYAVNAPIELPSGIDLFGENEGSMIVQGSGFSGGQLISLIDTFQADYHYRSCIRHLGFSCSGAVWAIEADAGIIINCTFQRLRFSCGYCLSLATYTQSCLIDDLFSGGSLNQLLRLRGNHNRVYGLDKENGTGSSVDPYVLIEGNSADVGAGNTLRHVLIEGTGSANKSAILIDGCTAIRLDDLWLETNASDGYGVRIVDCKNIMLGNMAHAIYPSGEVLKIDTSSNIEIELVSMLDFDEEITAAIEVDAASDVHIRNLRTRIGRGGTAVASPNITVDREHFHDLYTGPSSYPTHSPVKRLLQVAGQNLFTNGSFEAGRYGWTLVTPPDDTEEYIASEVGPGLMAHYVWTTADNHVVATQSIPVIQGVPVTFTAKVKVIGSGYAYPRAGGAGATNPAGPQRIYADEGWGIISQTFVPSSSGNFTIGLAVIGADEIYFDELTLGIGDVGTPNLARFGSLDLGGKTMVYAAAAPTTGTWKQGDLVLSTGASATTPPGWMCVSAGSPGTWQALPSIKTLAHGTLTTNAPTTIEQTWNEGSTNFNALVLDITNTASNSNSQAFVLRVDSADVFRVRSNGEARIGGASSYSVHGQHARLGSGGFLGWSSATHGDGSLDILVYRDGAGMLAQRNGTNAQTLRIYNTFTSSTDFERASIAWSGDVLTYGMEVGGSGGTARSVRYGGANGSAYLEFTSGGGINFTGWVNIGTDSRLRWTNDGYIQFSDVGDLLLSAYSTADFGLLQFGGITSSYPALKRSTTELQARLADDSGFAALQAILKAHANAVAETPTATHTIEIQDASGTAYKVLAVAA